MSNVCKHCTHAACLDVCPTGALFRTEFGTVVVQEDICNGCGYCIPACPYGVIDQRKDDGRAWKCTLCYDRIGDGLTPACAKACPTESIQYGELDELRERAAAAGGRSCTRPGVAEARLYGARPGRRRRRRRRVLPAARRAGGVRPAAGPGGAPPGTCRRCGGGPGWPALAMAAAVGGAPAFAWAGDREPARRTGDAAARSVPAGRVPLVLRAADRQGRRCGSTTSPAYLFTGGLAAGSRAARRRRRPDRPAGAAPRRPADRARRARRQHATSWSTTWAGRSASTTCCGWPSRPRRCRWAPGSSAAFGAGGRRWPRPPRPPPLLPGGGVLGLARRCCRRRGGRPVRPRRPSRRRWPRTPAVLLADTAVPSLARGVPGAAVRLRRQRPGQRRRRRA